MPDNCFWVNEELCIESCSEVVVPTWVRVDSAGPSDGRVYSYPYASTNPDYIFAPRASNMVATASGKLVVTAGMYWGDPAKISTLYSVSAFRSTDSGATWSSWISARPWVNGSNYYGYNGFASHSVVGGTEYYSSVVSGEKVYVISTSNDDASTPPNSNAKNYNVTSVSSDAGATWSSNTATTNELTALALAHNGSKLTMFSIDWMSRYVRSSAWPRFNIATSTDDGATWTTSLTISATAFPLFSAPWDYEREEASIAIDGSGRAHVAFFSQTDSTGTWSDVNVSYLRPTADATWASVVQLKSTYSPSNYRIRLVYSTTNTLMLFYESASSTAIMMRKSTDNGATWAAESTVITDPWIYLNGGWDVVKLASGKVVLVLPGQYFQADTSTHNYYLTTTDSGATWGGIYDFDDIGVDNGYLQSGTYWSASANGDDVVLMATNSNPAPSGTGKAGINVCRFTPI